jgi:hypothetical protein
MQTATDGTATAESRADAAAWVEAFADGWRAPSGPDA